MSAESADSRPAGRHLLFRAAPFAVLSAWVWLLNRTVDTAWWSADDPMILKQSAVFRPWQYFFVPAAWQARADTDLASFTPMLPLSFDLDLALFGQRPVGFYAHHLVVLAAVACVLFSVLRLYARRSTCLLATLLMMAGTPFLVPGQELMSRHYLEGLLFAGLSLLAYVRHRRGGGTWLLLFSLTLYAGSIAAKEIFLPLPLLLMFLPEGRLPDRVRAAGLYGSIGAAFLVWRAWMIGTLVGGPSNTVNWKAMALLPVHIAAYVLGHGLASMTAALLVGLGLVAIARSAPRRFAWLGLGMALITLLPLVPVATRLAPRHQVVPWVGACCVLALAAETATARSKRAVTWLIPLYLFVGTVVLHRGLTEQTRFIGARGEYSVQGKFSLAAGPNQAILATRSLNGLWFFEALHWLESERTGAPSPRPRILLDEAALEEAALLRLEVWQYDPSCRCMVDRSDEVPGLLARWRSHRRDAALSVVLAYENGVLSWQLGPYEEGTYTLLASDWIGARQFPPRGSHRLRLPEFGFQIRYDSPDGWSTYSPSLRFVPDRGGLSWLRRDEMTR